MTTKFPIAGLPVTLEEIGLFAREKIASLTPEEATQLLAEVEADEVETTEEEVIPKTAEDQEAFGVYMYQGVQEGSRRFNELSSEKDATYEDVMAKMASEIEAFDAETAALRQAANADPDQQLLVDMVEKVAQEDPAALAEFAAQRLGELGYEIKTADDEETEEDGAEGVEDETEEEAEEAAE